MKLFPLESADKLGLDIVLDRLKTHFRGEATARSQHDFLNPGSHEAVRAELGYVDELQQCLRFDDPIQFLDFPDIQEFLARVLPEGAVLDALELRSIARVLQLAERIGTYFGRRKEKYPLVSAELINLVVPSSPADTILGAIEDTGEIRDSASPELNRIRRELVSARGSVRAAAMKALVRASSDGFAADDQPTIRAGRVVIPVRAEAKRKVAGFVHDASATGQTVYIEPEAALHGNNRVRELELEEVREIFLIRERLSSAVRLVLPHTREIRQRLTLFDFRLAKATLGNEMSAIVPKVGNEGVIQIQDGFNPALVLHFNNEGKKRKVIPFSVELGKEHDVLIISGPNAGGKSITMKGIGLITTMVAMGMPVPVDDRSRVDVFDALYSDIGDEQSLSDDLSTFTSHLKNLSSILDSATDRSLVLIDEAGTGTDPEAGGALARAVLEQLLMSGVRTVVTTHFGPLKVFAHETERVANGSMVFDQSELRPTYEFVFGLPGSSYATEISQRAGMPDSVLTRAHELMDGGHASAEALIAELMERNNSLAQSLEETDRVRSELSLQRDTLASRLSSIEEEKQGIREKALEQADAIVRGANRAIERTIREIKESGANKEKTKSARDRLKRTGETLTNESKRTEKKKATRKKRRVEKTTGSSPIGLGDQVRMENATTVGEVLELEGKDALVAFGSMQMRSPIARLVKVGGKAKQQVSVKQSLSASGGLTAHDVRTRLDIRGKRVEEAYSEVVPFVDRGMAAGLSRMEVVHGKGTGALRQILHEILGSMDGVKGFEEAPLSEGGAGVTIIHFD
ncbi:MAG: endonuclease MutS2 [Bacteroidetes Order II. Incertae sedis bacterium]|nr:endonuclease MutS2 [Bacteroidetes Order II. bacterium]MBT7401268.1 endonuclease MutS2 [Bacteroidetes Order II. bacterium]